MGKYEELCRQIIDNIGGKENIKNVVHCMTRLRIEYINVDKINVEKIKSLKGVLGAQFSGEQFQIIIGQTVSDVYKEFCTMTGVAMSTCVEEHSDKIAFSIKKIPGYVLDYISGAISPVIPVFVVVGFFKLIALLFGSQFFKLFSDESQFVQTFNFVGNGCLYFMPVFVAWSAAKKLNTSIPVALMLGTLLIDPAFLTNVTAGEGFNIYGVFPAPLFNYTQTILPSLFAVWILKYVYEVINKYCPNSIKVIGVPFGSMLIMFPLTFCILAPVGNWVSSGIASFIEGLYNIAGPFAIMLIGAFWMLLVSTGMHVALRPIALLNLSTLGCDPIILAGSNVANYALMGMMLAFFLRSKGDERGLAGANTITLIVGGISEPTLFSVFLRNRRAMVIQMIGGAVGGLIGGLLGIKVYTLGAANFLNVLAYAGPGNNMLYACIACGIGFLVSFILGILFGFNSNKKVQFRKK